MLRKLIAIFSPSFSGSTLLELVIGSLPGITPVGESWVLCDERNQTGKGLAATNPCPVCGLDCPHYTPEFLATLKPATLYEQLSEHFSAPNIVTSDKLPYFYKDTLPEIDPAIVRAIVLFKSPEAFVYSFQRHDGMEGKPVRGIPELLNLYAQVYSEIYAFIDKNGYEHITVSYDDFCLSPAAQLFDICAFLNVPYTPKALEYWQYGHHRVGGNNGAKNSIWNKGDERSKAVCDEDPDGEFYKKVHRKIEPDLRWKEKLSDEQIAEIQNHQKAMETHRELEQKKLFTGN